MMPRCITDMPSKSSHSNRRTLLVVARTDVAVNPPGYFMETWDNELALQFSPFSQQFPFMDDLVHCGSVARKSRLSTGYDVMCV